MSDLRERAESSPDEGNTGLSAHQDEPCAVAPKTPGEVCPDLVYHQATGHIERPDGTFLTFGWAGNGIGKNNPSMDGAVCVGPLPRGLYVVGTWEDEHPHLGPIVASLTQVDGDTHGRSAFYFHGPASDPDRYGQESMGCIVVPRSGRLKVKEAAPEGSYLLVKV